MSTGWGTHNMGTGDLLMVQGVQQGSSRAFAMNESCRGHQTILSAIPLPSGYLWAGESSATILLERATSFCFLQSCDYH